MSGSYSRIIFIRKECEILTVKNQMGKIFYYPEIKGLSITGQLTDNTTWNRLKDTRIDLSIIGKGSDFMAMKTDTAGRFFFYLPDFTGYRDLFISAENTLQQIR